MVSSQGKLDASSLPDKYSALFPGGAGWSGPLALNEQGLYRIVASPELEARPLLLAEDIQVQRWGEGYLVSSPGASKLLSVTGSSQEEIPLTGELEQLAVLEQTVLLETSEGFFTLEPSAATPKPVTLPFPPSDAKLARGDGKVVIWSPRSRELMVFPGGTRLLTNVAPSLGVRLLNDGSVLASAEHAMTHFNTSGGRGQYIPPAGASEASFAEWMIIASGGLLDVITMKGERPHVLHYSGRGIPLDQLPEGKVRKIVDSAEQDGSPLLFLETSFKEPMFDDKGRPVLDLSSGTPRQQTVVGHKVFRLDTARSRWIEISSDPRAALVGPIQRVGTHAVYATQSEPQRGLGHRVELNRRYPYPPVILRGESLLSSHANWAYEKPRGSTPAKDRLPEHDWPVLGPDGPLLITAEDNSLLAIDPLKGELRWSTDPLPLDDSSPPMLSWSDGLALVATNNNTRRLITIDPKDGTIGASTALNDTFFWERWRHLLGVLVVCAALGYYIYAARKRDLYIRKIAGLQALDEAVGRATEMGKPVLYVVGLADVDDIQTLASLSILSHVARKTAEYDTPIVTTTARAVTFSAAQEIVRDAYSVAGRPDAFSVESVRYISDDQFGYTAGVDGIMVREKPAANFYIGNFYAESLILAETGHATGSIQIAGTSQPNQLPFFVAACDYTLIGEELFAASAYLSRDPLQVGSLRGQDVGKMIVMIILVVCSVLLSFGIDEAALTDLIGVSLP